MAALVAIFAIVLLLIVCPDVIGAILKFILALILIGTVVMLGIIFLILS